MTQSAKGLAKRQRPGTPLRDYVVPLLTPFTSELAVDHEGHRRNIDHILDIPGCGGLYVGSVYQEFWTLSLSERKELLETTIDAAAGRAPVVASASSPNVRDSIDLARHAEASGADVLMLWPPIFGPRDEEGVLKFYEEVCGEVEMPVCAYSTTLEELGFYLPPRALEVLAERVENVVAVKEGSFSITTYLALVSGLGNRLEVSSPFEEYWLAARAFLPDVAPEYLMGSSRALYMHSRESPVLAEFLALARGGRFPEAYQVIEKLRPLIEGIQMRAFETGKHPIAVVKYATELLGMAGGPVRPPTAGLHDESRSAIEQALESAGLLHLAHETGSMS